MQTAMEATTTTVSPFARGPTRGPRYYKNIVLSLAVSEFKLRYFGSVLGYFWTLARPLMLFGVLYVVFTHIVKFGGNVHFYALVLLTNIVLWQYFADATSAAVTSLVSRESLVRKMSFPLSTIPLSTVLTAAFNVGLNLVAVFVFIGVAGDPPTLSWLQFIPLVLALVLVSIPVAIILAVMFVRFRDVQHIWEVALQLGYWGTPIIYPIEVVPHAFQKFVMFNPLAVLIEQTRHVLIDPSAPTAAEAIGGGAWLLIPLAITLGLVLLSVVAYRREAPRVAELL